MSLHLHFRLPCCTSCQSDDANRHYELSRSPTSQTAPHWASSFLGRLERAHIDQERRNHAFIPRLEVGQLSSEWRAAKSRLLFIDLEETLMEDDAAAIHEQGFHVPTDVLNLLQQLCADAKNRVYLSSSRGEQDLEQIAAKVPRIGFISESGCQVSYAGEGAGLGPKTWTSLVAGSNLSWRGPVKELLSYFTERTREFPDVCAGCLRVTRWDGGLTTVILARLSRLLARRSRRFHSLAVLEHQARRSLEPGGPMGPETGERSPQPHL